MAAGLGFKTFNTGDVLTAGDTNGYLMQGVLVFDDAAARTSALASPAEGQFSFLKDTNSTEYYDGSAWAEVGGGGGGGASYTLLNAGGTALTGATTITVGSISGIEKLMIVVQGASSVNSGSIIRVIINGDTTGGQYVTGGVQIAQASSYQVNSLESVGSGGGQSNIPLGRIPSDADGSVDGVVQIDAGTSTGYKSWTSRGAGAYGSSANGRTYTLGGIYLASAAVTSVAVVSSSGNFDAGTIYVYGSAV